MILKIPSCNIDDTIETKDVLINIQLARRQARLKTTIVSSEDYPIDIVISRWGNPSLSKLSTIMVDITGEEMKSKRKFNCKVGFNFIHQKWLITGNIGATVVNETLDSFTDYITIIQKYFI